MLVEVHRILEAGLLEAFTVMRWFKQRRGASVEKSVPIKYKVKLLAHPCVWIYLWVAVIVECKAVTYNTIFGSQVFLYLRLTDLKLGCD